jgi:DNA modification methylase
MQNKSSSKTRAKNATMLDVEFGPIDPIIFDSVEYLRVEDIKIKPGNPRKHDKRNIEQIARAIAATRCLVPLVVEAGNMLVLGEGRLEAAKLLGLKTVPTLNAGHLSEAKFEALRIADNAVADKSVWDDQILAVKLQELSEMKLDFNIEHIGFEHAEIDVRITSLSPAPSHMNDPGDVLPEPLAFTVTRPGDVWLFGEAEHAHRVICGSALDSEVYAALMNGREALMSIQDPPYNVSVKKHVGGLGEIKHREFAMASGEMSETEFAAFLSDELRLAADHCAPGAVLMVFMDWRSVDKVIVAGKTNHLELLNLCVWNKTNGAMGSLYRSQHELVPVFKKPGAKHRNNVQLGRFSRYRTNVWTVPGCNTFGANRMAELSMHPTVKPLQLVADAIRDVSNRGDVVLDSFLGSGTTLLAAERTGRIAYGIELDPGYVDTAVRRWEQATSRQAVLEATGDSFAATAEKRAPSEQTAA